jgi:hypothetical protein
MFVSHPGGHSWTDGLSQRSALNALHAVLKPFLELEIVTFDALRGIILPIGSFIALARRKKENS